MTTYYAHVDSHDELTDVDMSLMIKDGYGSDNVQNIEINLGVFISRNINDVSLSCNALSFLSLVLITEICFISSNSAFRSSRNSGSMTLWMFSMLV